MEADRPDAAAKRPPELEMLNNGLQVKGCQGCFPSRRSPEAREFRVRTCPWSAPCRRLLQRSRRLPYRQRQRPSRRQRTRNRPARRPKAQAVRQVVPEQATGEYMHPPIDLLQKPAEVRLEQVGYSALQENATRLKAVLEDYGVNGTIDAVRPGPVVTLYETVAGARSQGKPCHGAFR